VYSSITIELLYVINAHIEHYNQSINQSLPPSLSLSPFLSLSHGSNAHTQFYSSSDFISAFANF
jgi:hypothetical protein